MEHAKRRPQRGIAIWSMKKWGIALGIALSVTTLIVAPSIYPFGVIDLPLAVIVLVCLLYGWFGDELGEVTQ